MLNSCSKKIVFFAILWLFFFACKRSVSPGYTDVDAIKDYIYSYPSIFLADVFDTLRVPPFYREITGRDNWIKIVFQDVPDTFFSKSAVVTWDDSIAGVFHTFISGDEYPKSFKAFSRVQAYFEQWGGPGDIYRGWLLRKVSNVTIYSIPSPSAPFTILSIDTLGKTIPLNLSGLYDLKDIPQFRQSLIVSCTLQVLDPSDLYYLHIYEGGNWRKYRFAQVGANKFAARWTVNPGDQDFNVYKHAYLDYINSESVADDSAKYSSYTLGIIYRIK